MLDPITARMDFETRLTQLDHMRAVLDDLSDLLHFVLEELGAQADHIKEITLLNTIIEGRGLTIDNLEKQIDNLEDENAYNQSYIDGLLQDIHSLEEQLENERKA